MLHEFFQKKSSFDNVSKSELTLFLCICIELAQGPQAALALGQAVKNKYE